MNDVDRTESDVDSCVEVSPQRSSTISLIEGGFAGGDGPIEHV